MLQPLHCRIQEHDFLDDVPLVNLCLENPNRSMRKQSLASIHSPHMYQHSCQPNSHRNALTLWTCKSKLDMTMWDTCIFFACIWRNVSMSGFGWGGESFCCSVGGWASGGPARSKVTMFFLASLMNTWSALLSRPPYPRPCPWTATQIKERTRRCVPFRIDSTLCGFSSLFT